tara:strand:- start:627 stop:980 length:354 start_codon:yes stop_codon:yes gene_type:complete
LASIPAVILQLHESTIAYNPQRYRTREAKSTEIYIAKNETCSPSALCCVILAGEFVESALLSAAVSAEVECQSLGGKRAGTPFSSHLIRLTVPLRTIQSGSRVYELRRLILKRHVHR